MVHTLTNEQIEALLKGGSVLGEPTKPSRKPVLESTVQERTPRYISLNNPQYDAELMEAHLELASIYGAEGNITLAHSHFKNAEHEFFNMSTVETQIPKYIMGGKDGFQRFQEQKDAIEKRLGDYKTRLVETADKIGYDATSLMFIPTSDRSKSNLVDLIK